MFVLLSLPGTSGSNAKNKMWSCLVIISLWFLDVLMTVGILENLSKCHRFAGPHKEKS